MAILIPIPDEAPRDDAHDRLRDLISAINGYSGQGIQWNLTTYDSDSRYGMQLRNLGADGLHFAVFHSGSTLSTDTPIVEIQDAGLFITDTDFRVYDGLNVVLNVDSGGVTVGSGYPVALGGGLSVTGEIIATGDITSGGTLEADNGLDVIGGATISGVISLNGAVTATSTLTVTGAISGSSTISGTQLISTIVAGTSPLVVASTTLVSNLNADLLDGQHASAFSLSGHSHSHDHDSDYVNESGDSMSGSLEIGTDLTVLGDTILGTGTSDSVTIQGGASALILRYEEDPADGQWAIGLNDGANPHLVFKDTAGVEVIKFRADSSTDPQFECSNWGKFDNQLSVGGGDSDFLKVYGGTEAIYVYYSPTSGFFTIGASNETDPNLQFKDNSGDNILTLYDDDNNETVFGSGESVQAKLFGGLWIADKGGDSTSAGLYVDGKAKFEYIYVGSSSSVFTGAVDFQTDVSFSSGADLNLGALSYLDTDEGIAGSVTRGGVNWDGYFKAKHDGSIVRVYYWND